MSRLIWDNDAIDAITMELDMIDHVPKWVFNRLTDALGKVPSAESLTDAEQRIFLAAMEREEKVCKEIDGNLVREAYEDSLFSICREIKRKVKGALWT